MASRSAPRAAPATVQTNTYNMNISPQETSCTQHCYPCAVCLIVIACLSIFGGILYIILGAVLGKTFYSLYGSPASRQVDQIKLYIGITLLIVGVILMILGIVWCRRIRRNFSPPVMYSGVAMTTTVVPPPIIQGAGGQPTYVYSYQPTHQAGSIQYGQPATNQFTPVQPASYQFHSVHPTVPPSAPSAEPPNQPPPSYNELMHSDRKAALSHGTVMTVV